MLMKSMSMSVRLVNVIVLLGRYILKLHLSSSFITICGGFYSITTPITSLEFKNAIKQQLFEQLPVSNKSFHAFPSIILQALTQKQVPLSRVFGNLSSCGYQFPPVHELSTNMGSDGSSHLGLKDSAIFLGSLPRSIANLKEQNMGFEITNRCTTQSSVQSLNRMGFTQNQHAGRLFKNIMW